MKIKIEKNVPIPKHNPWSFRQGGNPSPWSDGVLNTMNVGDSFLLKSEGGIKTDEKLEMQIRALRSYVHAQRRFKGSTLNISQRKVKLGKSIGYRIWRVE